MQVQNKIGQKYKSILLIALFLVSLIIGLLCSQIPPKVQKGFKSYLNQDLLNGENIPRGWRNNNPGNLVYSVLRWEGKIPYTSNTDGLFEQFIDFKSGIRALIKDLISKIKNQGSIAGIIYKYAPPFQNDTLAYINAVSQETGFAPNQALSSDRLTLSLLATAITRHENGKKWAISTEDFESAYLSI